MFLPLTVRPEQIAGMTPEQLEAEHQCMCGKDVRLRDCLAVWTHPEGNEKWQWFAVCHAQCVIIHVSEGTA